MKQNTLKPYEGSTKTSKRRGRGQSGGNYSGRGMKGQSSRTGSGVRGAFEGGQTPLVRRMPKLKGFNSPVKKVFFPLNLNIINQKFVDGDTVSAETLKEKGIMNRKEKIKLLASGDLTVKVKILVDQASESAIKKAEKAGATVTLPEKRAKKEKKEKKSK
ncbi:MAG: 50S ribosomal protein L15 [Candidatus Gracilibacteria bacterium]